MRSGSRRGDFECANMDRKRIDGVRRMALDESRLMKYDRMRFLVESRESGGFDCFEGGEVRGSCEVMELEVTVAGYTAAPPRIWLCW